jgi:hypothetical protein
MPDRAGRVGGRIEPVKLIRHPAADPDPEEPGNSPRNHDLVRRANARCPPGQDGYAILLQKPGRDARGFEAAGQAPVLEPVVDPAVDASLTLIEVRYRP